MRASEAWDIKLTNKISSAASLEKYSQGRNKNCYNDLRTGLVLSGQRKRKKKKKTLHMSEVVKAIVSEI
jgi:hypothetical protein